jgi:hypothetical protein
MTIKDQIILEKTAFENQVMPMHEFLLRNGKDYAGQDLPSNYKYRTPKMCFYNAERMALDRRFQRNTLRYCEGFARSKEIPLLIHHAWLINEFGEVIDPTLRKGSDYDYFGVWFYRDQLLNRDRFGSLLCTELHYDVEFMCKFDVGFHKIVYAEKPSAVISS